MSRSSHIEIRKAANGEFYFRQVAANGEPQFVGEGYGSVSDAKRGVVDAGLGDLPLEVEGAVDAEAVQDADAGDEAGPGY